MCEATSNTNRQHKDRLFKKVFDNKEYLLSLYNAINDTDYSNPDDVEINTIEDFIYMSMKNDVSFLIQDALNLYEHQSSQNPNMALRGFLYFAELYKGMITGNKDIYSSEILPLPTPQFIVFYNGTAEEPDESYVRMSDAFTGRIAGAPALDCTARMLNINYGHNKELMNKCKRLRDYSIIIQRIRDNHKSGMTNAQAIDKAVDDCIKDGILVDILEKHRLEVTQVLLTEYDETLHINNEKDISFNKGKLEGLNEGIQKGHKEGIKEGEKKGIAIGLLKAIQNLMKNENKTFEEACSILEIMPDEQEKYRKQL